MQKRCSLRSPLGDPHSTQLFYVDTVLCLAVLLYVGNIILELLLWAFH